MVAEMIHPSTSCLLQHVFLVLLLFSGGALASWTTNANNFDKGIFEWMHESEYGGYYNPKQEIRHAIPDDPSSMLGVFAADTIEEGEILCTIPWKQLLHSVDEHNGGEQLSCGLTQILHREWVLGSEKSQYGPYIAYLQEQDMGQIPSVWTTAGQNFLKLVLNFQDDVVIDRLPPTDPFNWVNEWERECEGNASDPIAVQAAMLVLQRSDDNILIPAYDFYNHKNGAGFQNAGTEIIWNQKHETRANRRIEKGEQIHISYNMCPECGGRIHSGYGTAELMRDYGFVEMYPQRWGFRHSSYQFDLEENTAEGSLTVTWNADTLPYGPVERQAAQDWFRRQILRLRRLESRRLNPDVWSLEPGNSNNTSTTTLPQREWFTIWTFQKANVVAMEAAIASLDEPFEEGTESTTVPTSSVAQLGHYDRLTPTIECPHVEQDTCHLSLQENAFLTYVDTEEIQTAEHSFFFSDNTMDPDQCLFVDDRVEICTSFQNHSMEWLVHEAASFLPTIRRVLIIGDGTGMALQEVLKHNATLDKVVCLYNDVAVTQASREHFSVDPHFKDGIVEWWFGYTWDGLQVLEDDPNAESFDLVLSFLKPRTLVWEFPRGSSLLAKISKQVAFNGILVQKDAGTTAMASFENLFSNTVQFKHYCPLRCSLVTTLGSPSIDFWRAPYANHSVDTTIFHSTYEADQHLASEDSRWKYIEDYRHNARNLAEESDSAAVTTERLPVSIVLVVDVISVGISVLSGDITRKVEGMLIDVTGEKEVVVESLAPHSAIMAFGGNCLRIRCFLDKHRYCAVDLFLADSALQHRTQLRSRIVQVLQGERTESYNLLSPMEIDEDELLPSNPNSKGRALEDPETCEADSSTSKQSDGLHEERVLSTVVSELIRKKKPQMLLLCGNADACDAAETDLNRVGQVTTFETCKNLHLQDGEITMDSMEECEADLIRLMVTMQEDPPADIDVVVIDSSVPEAMLQVLHSGMLYGLTQTRVITSVIVLASSTAQENRSMQFLHRLRKRNSVYDRPSVTIGVELKKQDDASRTTTIGILHSKDFRPSFHSFEATLQEKLGSFASPRIYRHGRSLAPFYERGRHNTALSNKKEDREETTGHLGGMVVMALDTEKGDGMPGDSLTADKLCAEFATYVDPFPMTCKPLVLQPSMTSATSLSFTILVQYDSVSIYCVKTDSRLVVNMFVEEKNVEAWTAEDESQGFLDSFAKTWNGHFRLMSQVTVMRGPAGGFLKVEFPVTTEDQWEEDYRKSS